MKKILIAILIIVPFAFAGPKPMESIARYNVVLVHGAADAGSGIEKTKGDLTPCENDTTYPDAAKFLSNNRKGMNGWFLGDAAKMIGAHDKRDHINYWLDSLVFEDVNYRNGLPFVGSSDFRVGKNSQNVVCS